MHATHRQGRYHETVQPGAPGSLITDVLYLSLPLAEHPQLAMIAITSIFFKTKPNANKLFCVSSTNTANLLGSVAVQVIHHHPQLFWNVHRLFSLNSIITHF